MLLNTFLISMPGGSEWFLILIALPLYFLPTIVAMSRNNRNAGGIFALNFLLGWTFLGWIGAFIWALSANNKPNPTLIVNNTSQSYSQEYKAAQAGVSPQIQHETETTKLISQQDKIDQLRQLKQLLDEGILTAEEFNKQKASILG